MIIGKTNFLNCLKLNELYKIFIITYLKENFENFGSYTFAQYKNNYYKRLLVFKPKKKYLVLVLPYCLASCVCDPNYKKFYDKNYFFIQ